MLNRTEKGTLNTVELVMLLILLLYVLPGTQDYSATFLGGYVQYRVYSLNEGSYSSKKLGLSMNSAEQRWCACLVLQWLFVVVCLCSIPFPNQKAVVMPTTPLPYRTRR